MSSFIGHSLTAVTIGIAYNSPRQPPLYRFGWYFWLIVISSFPDLDHFIPWLHQSAHQQTRITHSLTFALIFPICTILLLTIKGVRGSKLKLYSWQVILAGLSQILLDLLVGVVGIPLFYPFSRQNFKLPWGILPSAGKLDLSNYYLYRNLLIEMGVLLPILSLVIIIRYRLLQQRQMQVALLGLPGISACFMFWAYNLSR
ncbi:MAG: metal-dependent hydrolase [Symploca sp. SIO3E6]|nr:metal-dependent hydrolase [Caldora sp. SIO3E6]